MLTILPPPPDRLFADREAIESEMAHELERELRDTERCPPPTPPGAGARLVVDVVAGEPVSARHSGFARLLALANTRNPDLFSCAMASSRRTTIAGKQVTLPPTDEVLERLVDGTEPMLSSEWCWPVDEAWDDEATKPDDPNDNDDPDDIVEANP